MVDTVNFKRETSLEGSSANTHIIERFTRAGANTLLYLVRGDGNVEE